MKHLLIFLICLMSLDVIGQEGFIETDYPRRFNFTGVNRFAHIYENERLTDDGLRSLFQENTTSLNFLQTGQRDKNFGLPLIILGSAGMISSLFFIDGNSTDLSTGDYIFHSSLLVGSIGSVLINSYTRNRLRAVNNYNRALYEDKSMFQNVEPLLELEYGQNPFQYFSYYQEGYRLNNRALTSLMGNQERSQELMRKANSQRGLGTGLTIAGSVGLLTGTLLLLDDQKSGLVVTGGSIVSLISGGILLNASRSNRQSAVNLYNKQLFESASGMGTLNFRLNPNAGGLVLNF